MQVPLEAVLTGRKGPGRARTVASRAGAALTGAVRTGRQSYQPPSVASMLSWHRTSRLDHMSALETCRPPIVDTDLRNIFMGSFLYAELFYTYSLSVFAESCSLDRCGNLLSGGGKVSILPLAYPVNSSTVSSLLWSSVSRDVMAVSRVLVPRVVSNYFLHCLTVTLLSHMAACKKPSIRATW